MTPTNYHNEWQGKQQPDTVNADKQSSKMCLNVVHFAGGNFRINIYAIRHFNNEHTNLDTCITDQFHQNLFSGRIHFHTSKPLAFSKCLRLLQSYRATRWIMQTHWTECCQNGGFFFTVALWDSDTLCWKQMSPFIRASDWVSGTSPCGESRPSHVYVSCSIVTEDSLIPDLTHIMVWNARFIPSVQ